MARPLVAKLLALDPLTAFNHCMPGWLDLVEGRFEAAIPAYRKGCELDPRNPILQLFHGWVLVVNDQRPQAAALFDVLAHQAPGTAPGQLGRFWRHVLKGDREAALEAISSPELQTAAQRTEFFARQLADGCALVGANDRALALLSKAVDLGFIDYPYLSRLNPLLKGLRGETGFAVLMEAVKVRWERFDA